jgi:crotonobetainyl-CoA:carnitine CoA-transferase CaiB-like acyl-CoA transferase
VLDLTGLLPGPYASLLLADLGADVIKVESRLGDLMRQAPPKATKRSAYFLSINRNKRSVGLNIKKPAGRKLFLDLARQSDVVIEGFRPGRVARLGIDADTVRAQNPRIVYCSISGFGQTGPDASRAGHDLTYLARSGVLGLTGAPDGIPVPPPVQIADLAAATTAALAICAALFDRERSGEGRVLDISMLESIVPWMSIHLGAHQAGAVAVRGAMPLSGGFPCYNVYRTSDGGHVALSALEPLFWADFCRAIDRPDLAGVQFADGAKRTELFDELGRLFGSRATSDWAALFREKDLSAEVVSDLDDVLADPQLRSRGALLILSHPEEGQLVQVASPVRESGEDEALRARRPMRLPPDLAADTRPVLRDLLDLGDAAIDNLFASGVVFGPDDVTPQRVDPEALS